MSKIDELQEKRKEIISEIDTLLSPENEFTSETRKKVKSLEDQYNKIDVQIELFKDQAIRSKTVGIGERTNETGLRGFTKWLNNSIQRNNGDVIGNFRIPIELRENPLLSTSDPNWNTKFVNKPDVLYSPARETLEEMGVVFHLGLEGEQVYPTFEQDTATFVDEASTAANADITPESFTTKPKRVSHVQLISREDIVSNNTAALEEVYNNLINGIWNAVENRYFDRLDTLCATQIVDFGRTVDISSLAQMEASLGSVRLTDPAYVMRPETKSYLKTVAKLPNQDAVWKDDKVNDLRAIDTPAVNEEKVYFGEFKRTFVDQWGKGIEIIVDPYTKAPEGLIQLTSIGFFETGVLNKRAITIMSDASTY